MTRLKLDIPSTFRFSTELPVRVTDINYGQHLGNDAVLAFAHEARIRFLRSNGMSEKDCGGAGLIMLDAAIVYRAQAFLGDVLTVEVDLGEFGPAGFEFYYRLTRKSDGAEIARLKTSMAFFDYAANKVCRMPEGFRKAIPGAGC